jgi:hypothetical protein
MSRLKSVFVILGIATVICTTVVAVLLATLDDEDYRRILTWTVDHFTDYRIIINGPLTLDLSMVPSLAISDFRIEHEQSVDPLFSAQMGQLKVMLAIKPLLSGIVLIKKLHIEDGTIAISIGGDTTSVEEHDRISRRKHGKITIPILEHVTVRNVNISYAENGAEAPLQVSLRSFRIDDVGEADPVNVKGEGAVNNAGFIIEGQFGSVEEALDNNRTFPIDVSLRSTSGKTDVEFMAKGSIDNLKSGDGADISFSGSSSNRDVIRLLFPDDLHDVTAFSFEARLRHVQGENIIEGVSLSLSEGKDTKVSAEGGLALGSSLVSPQINNIDLKFNGKAKDTKYFRTFLFDWLPLTGPVTGEVQLTGSDQELALKGLNVTAGKAETVLIKVKGRLDRIPLTSDPSVSGLDLDLTIKSEKPPVLFAGFDIPMPELVSVSARTRLHGSGDHLLFEDITSRVTDPLGVTGEISGSAGLELRENMAPLGRLDLKTSWTAESIASFTTLIAAKALPDLGPASCTVRIKGTTETLSLEDIVIKAGQGGPVYFTWQGRIGKVTFGAEQPVSDVDLASSLHAENTSLLSTYAGFSIPDLGPLKGSSHIVARKDGYGAEDIEIIVGRKEDVRLTVKGRIEHVMRRASLNINGIDLVIIIPGLDMQAFSEPLGEYVAALGKISGSFTLAGGQEVLSVSDADLETVSPDGLKISARGSISHIQLKEKIPVHGVNIELSATAPDMTAVRKITDTDLPDLGPLRMSLRTKDKKGTLIFEKLKIRAGTEKKPTLLVEGAMKSIPGKDELTGALTFKTQTGLWMEKFFRRSVPEDHMLAGDLRLSGKEGRENLEGTINVGKTKIAAAIERSFVNERTRINAKLSASKIYLSDFDFNGEDRQGSEGKPEKGGSGSDIRLFSDEPFSFDKLKKLDLFLSLTADELATKNFTLNNLNLDVTLDNGLLQHRLQKLTHADGFITMEITIDTGGSKPELILKVTGKDIDSAEFLSHLHSPFILDGQLNVAVDLQSGGSSPREIASALRGEIGFAVENGQIKEIVDLLGADVLDVLTTVGTQKEYEKLDCLAASFLFKDGVGTSQGIYLETTDVRSHGKGTVDLREETLDLVIEPKPKKGQLGGSSPVHIQGSLTNPQVIKIPFREAARLTGEIMMPYVFLPVRAMGYTGIVVLNEKDEDSPCFSPEK